MNDNNFCGIHFAGQMCYLRVKKAGSREQLERHQDANNFICNEQE